MKQKIHSTQPFFSWQTILKMAMAHKKNFIYANIVSVLATVIYLPVPLIIPSLVNEVVLKQPGFFTKVLSYFISPNLISSALIMTSAFILVLSLRIIEEILKVYQSREFKIISKDIVFQIREKLLLQLNKISIKEYETLGSGKLVTYYIKDLDTIDEFLGNTTSQFAIAIMALIGVVIVLFFINWIIALFVLLFNPISLILTAKFSKKLKELKTEQHKAFEVFQDAFIETIDAIHQIRADNRESHFIQWLLGKARRVRDNSIAYEWKKEIVGDLSGILLFVGVDLYYLLSITLILLGKFTIGMMLALLQYVFQVQFYLNIIVDMQAAFYAADAALTRINEAMKLETEAHYIEKENPFIKKTPINIEIKNLQLSYLPDKPVLNNINMQIEGNKRIGIIGPSGAGKSSWIQALLGFYPIDQGEIKINNIDVYDIGFELIRNNISTVLQSPVIFNDTVRSNLTFDSDINDDAIWEALDKAQLKKTIETFEQGLDTIVGRRGVRLSGGQRQRLAIARMLLRNSKVVILDEATSALDYKTEHVLLESIKDFLSSRTTIIVTHRLNTIRDADKIYVIDNGRLAEEGTHSELIKRLGIYYSLYTLQKAENTV